MNSNPFFNAGHLDNSVSLNKINMVDIPGVMHSRNLAGKTAHDVLSSDAIVSIIRKQFPELGNAGRVDAFTKWHKCLSGKDVESKIRARLVCEQIARNLGCLLLMLSRQNINKSAARLDWSDAQWQWWASIERYVIGGGVLAGDAGKIIYNRVHDLFVASGLLQASVELSTCAEYMPLIGAANKLANENGVGCVLDFGHTSCKRAVVGCEGNCLKMLDKSYIGDEVSFIPEAQNLATATALDARIREIACSSVKEAASFFPGRKSISLLISIANYFDGYTFATRGGYAKLNLISRDYRKHLQQALREQVAIEVQAEFIHDCTAAALSVSHGLDKKTAVIVLGTGLGAGFCEHKEQ